jgi:hypothetical protein
MPTVLKAKGRKASAAKAATPPVADLVRALDSSRATIRFASAKALSELSKTDPQSVYPYFDEVVKQLDSENSILRWNAMHTLANLAPLDSGKKLDALLDRFLSPIRGPQMIGAANTIAASADIALAKPYLADRIATAILQVRDAKYRTDECRHIAVGHAIEALGRFLHLVKHPEPVVDFVRGHRSNPRPSTRSKAEVFLLRYLELCVPRGTPAP